MMPWNRSNKILYSGPATVATRRAWCRRPASGGDPQRQSESAEPLAFLAEDVIANPFECTRVSCDEGETDGVLVRYEQVGVAAPQEEW